MNAAAVSSRAARASAARPLACACTLETLLAGAPGTAPHRLRRARGAARQSAGCGGRIMAAIGRACSADSMRCAAWVLSGSTAEPAVSGSR